VSLLEHLPGRVVDPLEDTAEAHGLNCVPFVTRQRSVRGQMAPNPAQLTKMSSDQNAC
jgi:hypothetical protein